MFGRATIRLGIGPHSYLAYILVLFVHFSLLLAGPWAAWFAVNLSFAITHLFSELKTYDVRHTVRS